GGGGGGGGGRRVGGAAGGALVRARGGRGESRRAGRQGRERGGGGGVGEPAVGRHPPERVVPVGREVHRVQRDRAERRGRRPLRLRNGPPGLAEQPRQDPEAHRRLMAQAARHRAPAQPPPAPPHRLALLL